MRQKTSVKEIDGSWVEITTPYLDRHNDALQIYAAQSTEGYLLTDDSYTIRDLEASGCNLSTGKRNDLLRMTLNGFGVKLNKEALEIQATAETFSLRKHSLVQAMLAVNNLFYLAQPKVESLFLEDVTAWLDSADVSIRRMPSFQVRAATITCSSLSFQDPPANRSGLFKQ